jgi:hypothetical protein
VTDDSSGERKLGATEKEGTLVKIARGLLVVLAALLVSLAPVGGTAIAGSKPGGTGDGRTGPSTSMVVTSGLAPAGYETGYGWR